MSAFWQHVIIAAVVIAATVLLARFVDRRIAKRGLPPEAVTRYRIVRQVVVVAIVFVGVFSALLVIPEVRAIAGGVLASSAVIGLIVGFASQRTIGNAVAGILIAFAQPLRLGDQVTVGETTGVVEEIGLTYTWIRTPDNDRYVVPNEKLASEAIRNATIHSTETCTEASVQVPLAADLRRVLESLRVDGAEAYLSELGDGTATFVVRRWIPRERESEQAASELRLAVAERLRAAGVIG